MILPSIWRRLRRRRTRVAAAVLASLLCAPGSVSAVPLKTLDIFAGAHTRIPWRSDQGPQARAQMNVKDGAPGLRLICPLKSEEERCFWEADMRLDLSGTTEIVLSIRATQPAAISRCSLHFRSGEGWYGGWFEINGPGWQTVRIARHDFAAEGSPTGWGMIEGVRLSFWRGEARDTIVTLAGLQGNCDSLLVLRNSDAAATLPKEMATINRTVDRVSRWFEAAGVSVGNLNDDDVKDGVPAGCQLLVLPYNPQPPETTIKSVVAFAARGGRIIAAYHMPSELAPVLGLKGTRWMATGPSEAFASIRFCEDPTDGFPFVMHQDSWNANIPLLDGAEVLGYWQDGAGVTSALPAVTISTNGAFIGHVLTNMDREQKTQFLVALAATVQPDMKAELAAAMMARSQRLFGLADGVATRAFIRAEAIGALRPRTEARLAALDRYCEASVGITNAVSFGELQRRADETRKLTQAAYFGAVPNRGVTNEFRGVWCHSPEGVDGLSWDDAVRDLKRFGFNTLFANMVWAGVAYYPSSSVPVSPLVRTRGDLLKQCLSACRKHGVDLHVWKVCWNLTRAAPAFVKAMRRAGRLQQNADGTEQLWLCPSDPRNRDLELSAVVEVARNYDVAGIHLDYIRYPSADSCYCEGCRKRFGDGTALVVTNWPADVITGDHASAYKAWRSEQITSFVVQTAAAIKNVRQDIELSAAVFPSWPSCRETLGQDWVSWAKSGAVDFVCPMSYVTDAAEAASLTTAQLAAVGAGARLYPSLGPSTKGLPPEQVVRQVDWVRKAGAKGFVLFELDRDLLDVHLPALRAGATAE